MGSSRPILGDLEALKASKGLTKALQALKKAF